MHFSFLLLSFLPSLFLIAFFQYPFNSFCASSLYTPLFLFFLIIICFFSLKQLSLLYLLSLPFRFLISLSRFIQPPYIVYYFPLPFLVSSTSRLYALSSFPFSSFYSFITLFPSLSLLPCALSLSLSLFLPRTLLSPLRPSSFILLCLFFLVLMLLF